MKKINLDKEIHNLEKLKTLSICDKISKKKIITKSDKIFICVLKDCIYNILLGNIELTDSEKDKLRKHKYTLRKIINTKQANKNKDILIQKGGSFLPIILPGAITLLTTLIELINKK